MDRNRVLGAFFHGTALGLVAGVAASLSLPRFQTLWLDVPAALSLGLSYWLTRRSST